MIEGLRAAARPLRRQRVGHRRRSHVHRHGRRAGGAAHVQPSVRPRDPGRHAATRRSACGRARITAAGRTFDVTPDRWKGVRDRSWGVRPVGEPEAPGHQGRASARTATGSATTGCRCSSTTTCSRSRSTRTPTATATSRSRCGCGTSSRTARSSTSVAPEVDIDYLSGTREMRARDGHRAPTLDGEPIIVTNTPLRTLYLAAGSGYVPDDEWGHGVLPGPAEGRGRRARPVSDPEERAALRDPQRDAVPVRARRPARSATACTRTCSSASTARPASSPPTPSPPDHRSSRTRRRSGAIRLL